MFAYQKFSFCTAAAAFLLIGSTLPSQAEFTTNAAITTLQIFRDGGDDLVDEVSKDILSDITAVGAYCLAAGSARIEQKVAVMHGIVATNSAVGRWDESLMARAQQCCPLFTSVSIDERIGYGAQLALEARRAFDEDRRISARMKMLVNACSDDVLDRSFELALGNDRIGLFVAQESEAFEVRYQTASTPEDDALSDYY